MLGSVLMLWPSLVGSVWMSMVGVISGSFWPCSWILVWGVLGLWWLLNAAPANLQNFLLDVV